MTISRPGGIERDSGVDSPYPGEIEPDDLIESPYPRGIEPDDPSKPLPKPGAPRKKTNDKGSKSKSKRTPGRR